jgi:hypothetical protein
VWYLGQDGLALTDALALVMLDPDRDIGMIFCDVALTQASEDAQVSDDARSGSLVVL